ncbi:MAG: hypothetical protein LUG85_02520 [Clostridiales bacterium]|nr:hypothetical protein [Clostridiales bacterium]
MKRKLICSIMSVILIFSSFLSVTAFAESGSTECEYPFVLIRGMDFNGLYVDIGTENEEECLKPITFTGVIRTVFNALGGYIKTGTLDGFTDPILDYVNEIMGSMACDENGNSVYNVSSPEYPLAVSNYPELLEALADSTSEQGILKEAVEEYGAENVYYMVYDWRLDPLDNCDKLYDLIELAKSEHDAEKVNLVCCSMGGIITDAYLYKYGCESFNKIIFDSTVFCGTDVVTELFQGKVNITGETLSNYVTGMISSGFISNILEKSGIFDRLAELAMKFVEQEKDYVYENFLVNTFGTMPALWALVQCEDYQACLDYMFPTEADREKYSGLIERADALQEMMSGMDEILTALPEQGVAVAVVASYGSALAPVYESANTAGDSFLESHLMLGRAVVANHNEQLPDDYTADDETKLSPDRCVDLSNCLFPEYTWAICGSPHVAASYGTDFSEFLFWLVNYDGQPTVTSNPNYPQFMLSGSDEHLELFG